MQVVEYVLRALRRIDQTPTRFSRGTPTVEARLESMHVAELSIGDERAQREIVAVPSAILKRNGKFADPVRKLSDLVRLCGGGRERLVHHHMRPRLQCGSCQRIVRDLRRADGAEIRLRVEQGSHVGQNLRVAI